MKNFFLLTLFLIPSVLFAQGLQNPLTVGSIEEFLLLIFQVIVQVGAIVLVFMLVFVGFKFVTAQGVEKKLTEAKSALMWTVIGGLVLLGAQTIAMVIQATVNSLR